MIGTVRLMFGCQSPLKRAGKHSLSTSHLQHAFHVFHSVLTTYEALEHKVAMVAGQGEH